MDSPILGQLIAGDAHRDAIHIAIAPVIAAESLKPGDRIGFVKGSTETVLRTASAEDTIGIVDPFLPRPVTRGVRFYMLLLPNTITSLRHEWTHPAFPNAATSSPADRDASVKWITDFATEIKQDYDSIMHAARNYAETGDSTYDNSEAYKRGESWQKWPEFWKHYEVITGVKINDDEWEDCPFTCSC